jgi:hypothetical protein
MAVGENIRLHDHSFANDPFYRKTTAIDLGFDRLNDDPTSTLIGVSHSPPPRSSTTKFCDTFLG